MLAPIACSVTDWIQALGVVAGVVIAGLGLRAWYAQLEGGARHKAGMDLLVAVINYRQTLQTARRTVTFSCVIGKGERPEAARWDRDIDAIVVPAMAALDAAVGPAEILLGEDARTLTSRISALGGSVRAAIQNELGRRAGDDTPPDRLGLSSWTSDDPDHDRFSAAFRDAFAPLQAWVMSRMAPAPSLLRRAWRRLTRGPWAKAGP